MIYYIEITSSLRDALMYIYIVMKKMTDIYK